MSNSKIFKYHETLASVFLWSRSTSNSAQYTFFVASQVQLLIILIWAQLEYTAVHGCDFFSYSLHHITRRLSLGCLVGPQANNISTLIIIICWLYVMLLLVATVGVLRVDWKKSKYISATRSGAFFIAQFHVSVGFWMVSVVLLRSLYSYSHSEYTQSANSMNSMAVQIMSACLAAVNYILTFLYSATSYNPYRSQSVLACHTPIFQVSTSIYKAVLSVILVTDMTMISSIWTFVGLSFILSITRHLALVRFFPYYHSTPFKTVITLSSLAILISTLSVSMLTSTHLMPTSRMRCSYILACLCPLLIKLSLTYASQTIKKFFNKEDIIIMTEEEALRRYFAMTYYLKGFNDLRSLENSNQILSWSSTHSFWSELNGQSIQTAGLDVYKPISKGMLVAYDDYHNDLQINFLSKCVKSIKYNDKVKILMADSMYAFSSANAMVAIRHLLSVSKKHRSTYILANILIKQIQEDSKDALGPDVEKSRIDIKGFIDWDENSRLLTNLIITNTKAYIDFWKNYLQAGGSITKLLTRSEHVEKNDLKIKEIWNRNFENNKYISPSLGHLYSCYLSVVRAALFTAHKLESSMASVEHLVTDRDSKINKITSDTLLSPKNMIIHIVQSRDKSFFIEDVSKNVKTVSGWTKEQLARNEVKVVLPEFLEAWVAEGNHHENQNVSKSYMNRNIQTYIRTKDNCILICNAYIAMKPYVQQQLAFMIIARPIKQEYGYLIVNKFGLVKGASKDVKDHLSISHPMDRLYIEDLCLDENITQPFKEYRRKNSEQTGSIRLGTTFSRQINQIHVTDQSENKSFQSQAEQMQDLNREFDLIKNRVVVFRRQYHRSNELINMVIVGVDAVEGESYLFAISGLRSAKTRKICSAQIKNVTTDKAENRATVKGESDTGSQNDLAIDDVPEENISFNCIPSSAVRLMKCNRQKSPDQEALYVNAKTSLASGKALAHIEIKLVNFRKSQGSAADSENYGSFTADTIGNDKQSRVKLDQSIGSVVSVLGSKRNRLAQIERAIYDVPLENKMRVLLLYVLMVIMIASGLLFSLKAENRITLERLEGNVIMMTNLVQELISTLASRSSYKQLENLNQGFLTYDRYSVFGIPDSRLVLHPSLIGQMKMVKDLSNTLRNNLYKISEDLQYRIYQPLDIVVKDSSKTGYITRNGNQFDLIAEMTAETFRYGSKPWYQIKGNESEVAFFLNNSRNELLLLNIQNINIVSNDIQKKIEANMNRVINYTSLITSLLVLFLLIFMGLLYSNVQNRDKLISTYIQLDEKSLFLNMHKVEGFLIALDTDKVDSWRSEFKNDNHDIAKQNKGSNTIKKKSMDAKGAHKNIVFLLLKGLILIIITLSGYATFYIIKEKQNKRIMENVDMTINVNKNVYGTVISYVFLYSYLTFPGDQIFLGVSATEAMEQALQNTTGIEKLYANLIQSGIEVGQSPDLVEIMTGNLCKVLEGDAYAGSACDVLINGNIAKGFIRMTTYLLDTIRTAKQSFDNSHRTFNDSIQIMRRLIQLEAAMGLYGFASFFTITSSMGAKLEEVISASAPSIEAVVYAFLSLYITIGPLLLYKLYNEFEKERASWRKLLRLVPLSAIARSKGLQHMLFGNNKALQEFLQEGSK